MHISDTHEENIADIVISDLKLNNKIKEGVDILFITGDLTYRGAFKKLKQVSEQCEDLISNGYVSDVVLIPGNHDLTFQRMTDNWSNPRTARWCFADRQHIHMLIHEAKIIQGIKMFGSPWTPEFHNWAYNYFPDEAAEIWGSIPEDTEVLLTHGPPVHILDEMHKYDKIRYLGCPVLAERIKDIPSVRFHLFGHIHEGYGKLEKNGILYLNSSIMNGNYKPTNKPQYFTIEK